MAHMTFTAALGRYVVAAQSEVLGQSQGVVQLREGSYPPVLYVPRADIDLSKLQRSPRQTTCPHKGLCSYYHVVTAAGTLENAVWSYEAPVGDAQSIAGHLAFYPDKVSVTAV